MKTVFADSVYFFAVLNAHDRLHEQAVRYAAEGSDLNLTTAWVLTEVADGLCHRSARHAVVRLWQTLEAASDVEIVMPALELFQRGLERYRLRPDKDWSLTDCISFIVMEERGISEALTSDHHFQQAGFATLLGCAAGQCGTGALACRSPSQRLPSVVGRIRVFYVRGRIDRLE